MGASINEGSVNERPGKEILTNNKVMHKMHSPGNQMARSDQEKREFQDKFDQVSGQSKEYKNWIHKHRIDG